MQQFLPVRVYLLNRSGRTTEALGLLLQNARSGGSDKDNSLEKAVEFVAEA